MSCVTSVGSGPQGSDTSGGDLELTRSTGSAVRTARRHRSRPPSQPERSSQVKRQCAGGRINVDPAGSHGDLALAQRPAVPHPIALHACSVVTDPAVDFDDDIEFVVGEVTADRTGIPGRRHSGGRPCPCTTSTANRTSSTLCAPVVITPRARLRACRYGWRERPWSSSAICSGVHSVSRHASAAQAMASWAVVPGSAARASTVTGTLVTASARRVITLSGPRRRVIHTRDAADPAVGRNIDGEDRWGLGEEAVEVGRSPQAQGRTLAGVQERSAGPRQPGGGASVGLVDTGRELEPPTRRKPPAHALGA